MGSILGGSWDGFGKLLGRVWSPWPLLGGLLALFFASLTLKRPKKRPKRAQEASKRVPELDFGGFWGRFGKDFFGFGEGFGELFKGLEASWFLVALWGFDLPSSVFCCFLAVLAAF